LDVLLRISAVENDEESCQAKVETLLIKAEKLLYWTSRYPHVDTFDFLLNPLFWISLLGSDQ